MEQTVKYLSIRTSIFLALSAILIATTTVNVKASSSQVFDIELNNNL